jgi:hypothetical protein
MSELLIYESAEGAHGVSVRLDGDTVWLTQRQMGELFATTPENVLMHLKNIFSEGELDEPATAKDFLAVQIEGKREVQRTLKHYNLDAIISVGYRVNSKRGTRFRQWANRSTKAAHLLYFVIKDHPFSDGNKRIGSFLFLLYLHQEGMAMRINDNALTALALLVAESQPGNKDLMIRLVVNLLVSDYPGADHPNHPSESNP